MENFNLLFCETIECLSFKLMEEWYAGLVVDQVTELCQSCLIIMSAAMYYEHDAELSHCIVFVVVSFANDDTLKIINQGYDFIE